MSQKQTPNYTFALIIVIAVCFLIGFVTTMNNSMIESLKYAFNLNDAQGNLVNTAFYGAYCLSIPFAMMMNKIGYKSTLVLGLVVVACGFVANYFGLTSGSASLYNIFLGCMFIVAMGVVMLQLVANPYVMVLGAPEGGAFRMTLSQALNSVATTVAPIFITSIILGKETSQATPEDIPAPFLGLGIFTLALALILCFLKLPNIDEGAQAEEASGEQKQWKSSAFKYPHVWFGALGIFMYMGLEIGIPSMLPAYWKNAAAEGNPLPGSATAFLPFYWGGMMVGRFVGAAILSKFEPRKLLSFCLIMGALCVGSSFFLPGMIGVYAMLAAGLFHSVMWPLIFNLGLQDLGPNTKTASGLINMGVLGGATLPVIMALLIPSYGVGVAICMMFVYYAYVLWFTVKGCRVGLD